MFCRSHSSNSFLVARFGISLAASSGWIGVLPGTELRSEIGLIFSLGVSSFLRLSIGRHAPALGFREPSCARPPTRLVLRDPVSVVPLFFHVFDDVSQRFQYSIPIWSPGHTDSRSP